MYEKCYPDDLQQPIFYSMDDEMMCLRLPQTHGMDGESDGDLDMNTLEVEFIIFTKFPGPGEELTEENCQSETYRFDLSSPMGWEEMLAAFPQVSLQTDLLTCHSRPA